MIPTLPVVDALRPLLTTAAVAALPRTSPKAPYAMADRGQWPDLARIGRRFLVWCDDPTCESFCKSAQGP